MLSELSDYEWTAVKPTTNSRANYRAFVKPVSIQIWLLAYESTPGLVRRHIGGRALTGSSSDQSPCSSE
jgi:hypothetical protein